MCSSGLSMEKLELFVCLLVIENVFDREEKFVWVCVLVLICLVFFLLVFVFVGEDWVLKKLFILWMVLVRLMLIIVLLLKLKFLLFDRDCMIVVWLVFVVCRFSEILLVLVNCLNLAVVCRKGRVFRFVSCVEMLNDGWVLWLLVIMWIELCLL